VRAIGVVNTKNKIITSLVAQLLDGPAALRRFMMNGFVVEASPSTR
jgi:5-(hydroxymethyl)furfural/furfural oxidase